MHTALKSCLLLLLWGCDWAGDPYCGRCTWSQAWGNQHVVCHSVVARTQFNKAWNPTPAFRSLALATAADLPWLPFLLGLAWAEAAPIRSPGLIYVFMTLRR
jgi:hypothetical protein